MYNGSDGSTYCHADRKHRFFLAFPRSALKRLYHTDTRPLWASPSLDAAVIDCTGASWHAKSSPWPEFGNYDADFLAGLTAGQRDADEDDVLVRFTSRDVLALGQFFVLSMLKWVQSVQIARRRAHMLREAILAKMGAGSEYNQDGEEENLINGNIKWKERYE